MRPDLQIDRERLHFLAGMIHNIGHLVAELRNQLYVLERTREVRERRETLETVRGIAKVTNEITDWLRRMRFLFSDEHPVECDFVSDVLQPAVYLASRVNRELRLIVGQLARSVPHVKVRPGTATMGLLILLSAIDSRTVRCNASRTGTKDTFDFRISAKPPIDRVAIDLKERVITLLETSGIKVNLSQNDSEFLVVLRLKAVGKG